MEEDEFLFPEDDEGGVSELDQLWQGEQPGPEGRHLFISFWNLWKIKIARLQKVWNEGVTDLVGL